MKNPGYGVHKTLTLVSFLSYSQTQMCSCVSRRAMGQRKPVITTPAVGRHRQKVPRFVTKTAEIGLTTEHISLTQIVLKFAGTFRQRLKIVILRQRTLASVIYLCRRAFLSLAMAPATYFIALN